MLLLFVLLRVQSHDGNVMGSRRHTALRCDPEGKICASLPHACLQGRLTGVWWCNSTVLLRFVLVNRLQVAERAQCRHGCFAEGLCPGSGERLVMAGDGRW